MTNNNSHQIFGINYFREKAIAATVVLAVVLITFWLTGKDDKTGLADRDNDGVLDNVDKCPDEKGELKYEGCLIGKGQEDKTAKQPKDSEKQNYSPSESDTKQQSSFEPNSSANQEPTPPPQVAPQPPGGEVIDNVKKVESIDSQLKFDNKTNRFSWNTALSKASKLKLVITANGAPEEIDVTRRSDFLYSPNKGSMQGMKITAVLRSDDSKVPINKESPKTYSPNCSAD
jgi:hypothetical protein